MRFDNFNRKVVHLAIQADAGDLGLSTEAAVDMRRGIGFGRYSTTTAEDGATVATGLIAWSPTAIATTNGGTIDDVPPATAWTQRSIDRSSPLDVSLLLALKLGADRPENPALLQQSDARLLRKEQAGGRTLLVIRGPSAAGADDDAAPNGASSAAGIARTTYWIDTRGRLDRFEARLSGAPTPTTIRAIAGRELPAEIPASIIRALGTIR